MWKRSTGSPHRLGTRGEMPPGTNRIAKIICPASVAALPRPRLFRVLDRSRARLIWIAAPPGAGKTTLASSYVAARRRGGLWVSLDAADRDPASFIHYLARAAPRRRTPLPSLTAERRMLLPVFTLHFFDELGARLPATALLVFDNFHEVGAGTAVSEMLAAGL